MIYNDGTLNRLDRLTASNYGMPINTNLCENRFVKCNGATDGQGFKSGDFFAPFAKKYDSSLDGLDRRNVLDL